ncbi:MAG: biopolymer transporter ExbD [Planctomycetota bacterium]
MARRRRSVPEARLELAPLIDVVFLLLTFFVVAMTVLVQDDQVRAGARPDPPAEAEAEQVSAGPSEDDADGRRARLWRTLDLRFRQVQGEQAQIDADANLHVLTIDRDGALQLDGAAVEVAALGDRLRGLPDEPESRVLFVALSDQAESDRGPVLFDVLQRVSAAGWRATLVEPLEDAR